MILDIKALKHANNPDGKIRQKTIRLIRMQTSVLYFKLSVFYWFVNAKTVKSYLVSVLLEKLTNVYR